MQSKAAALILLSLVALVLTPSAPSIQPLQVKSCAWDPVTYLAVGGACQFDNPTQPGSLIAVVAGMGSNGTEWPVFCQFVSDSQQNSWSCANNVAYWNGIPIWYALNTAGGTRDIVYFAPHVGAAPILMEYPPATGFQGIGAGTYAGQNIDECQPQGVDCYIGWTLPIETDEPCELLLTWGNTGANGLGLVAGPDSTIRVSGPFFLEDRTTNVPGLYIGTAKWHYGNHWLMQSAAFKYGGCH